MSEQIISTAIKYAFCEGCHRKTEHKVNEFADKLVYWCFEGCGAAFTVRKRKPETHKMTLRLSDSDYGKLKRIAADAGDGLSQTIRDAIREMHAARFE